VLRAHGIQVYAAELTRDSIGIPVIAARSPGLLPVLTVDNPPLAGAIEPGERSQLFQEGFMLL